MGKILEIESWNREPGMQKLTFLTDSTLCCIWHVCYASFEATGQMTLVPALWNVTSDETSHWELSYGLVALTERALNAGQSKSYVQPSLWHRSMVMSKRPSTDWSPPTCLIIHDPWGDRARRNMVTFPGWKCSRTSWQWKLIAPYWRGKKSIDSFSNNSYKAF